MTISLTALTQGGNTVDASSFTTASVTPTANKLVLIAVASAKATLDTPTISGCGLTWVQVATGVTYNTAGSPSKRLSLFRAMSASPSSGAITIDFGGVSQSGCLWSVAEFDGVDTSGTNGSGAVVQSQTNSVDAGSGLTVTLSAFGDAGNATYGAFSKINAPAFVGGSGFTVIHGADVGIATPNLRLLTEFLASNDTTVDCTHASGSADDGGIAIEIKAFVAPPPPPPPPPGAVGTWTWEGSILDGLGRITSAGFDGISLFLGGDVGLSHKGNVFENQETQVPNGKMFGFNSGVAAVGSAYVQAQKHWAAIAVDIDNPSRKVALTGDGAAGAILIRDDGDAKWSLSTSTYWGNAQNKVDGGATSIPSTEPRQSGLRAAVLGNNIWASAYRAAAPTKGMCRSINGGTAWTAWRFDSSREYTGLVVSPNYQAAGFVVLYATDRVGGITVCRRADHASLSAWDVHNESGLTGLMGLCVVDEEGKDVAYIVNGCNDVTAGDRGVWKCVFTGDVANGSYSTAWTKVSTGLPASTGGPGSSPTNWWSAIAGRRRPGSGGVAAGDPTDIPLAPATEFPLPVGASPGWGSGWESLGTDKTYGQTPPAKGRVSAVYRHGDWVYIGGQFQRLVGHTGSVSTAVRHLVRVAADAVPANHGHWDSAWLPNLGNASDANDSGWVKHITSVDPGDGNGERLLVAGNFTDIGGVSVRRLACFRIATGAPTLDLIALPDLGINNIVTGVVADGTDLYLAGQFTQISGTSRSRLAKLTWNGTSWGLDPTWQPTLDTSDSLGGGEFKYGSKALPVPGFDRVVILGFYLSINGVNTKYISAVNKTNGNSVSWSGTLPNNLVTGSTSTNFPAFDGILVQEAGTWYCYSGHGGTNLAAKWNAQTGAREWYYCSNGGVQAVGLVNGKPVFGMHDNLVNRGSSDQGYTQKNQDNVNRTGIWMCNPDGTLVNWAPNVGGGAQDGTEPSNNGGPLKVWAISNDATHLYVGGDFTLIKGSDRARFAIFPAPTTGDPGTSVTELMVANHVPTSALTGTYPLNPIDGGTDSYVGSHYRSLDGGISWSPISDAVNVSMTVYNEADDWVQTEIPQTSTNKSRLGGNQYSCTQLVYDSVNEIMLSAGKGGAWRCDNPWDTTPVWSPMVSGLGAMIVRSVAVDPTNNNHVFISDVDRPVFRWLEGGDDQSHNAYMKNFDNNDPIQCLSYHPATGVLWAAQKAATAGTGNAQVYKNTAPWAAGAFSKSGITAPGTGSNDEAVSILAWNNGTTARLLVLTINAGVRYSSNGGSTWASSTYSSPNVAGYSAFNATLANDAAGRARFVAREGSPKVWMYEPHLTDAAGGGLWYSANSGQTWTRIWDKRLAANERIYGSIAQDATTETTLYLTSDDGGLWKVINADNGWLTDAGVNAGGTIATTHVITSRMCGAIAVDPNTGDIVACVPVTDTGNIPDILLSDDGAVTFTSIADERYPDLGYGPLDVAKVDDRIYVSLDGASVFVGSFDATIPSSAASYWGIRI